MNVKHIRATTAGTRTRPATSVAAVCWENIGNGNGRTSAKVRAKGKKSKGKGEAKNPETCS